MTIPTSDLQIIYIAIGILLSANVLAMGLFVLFAKLRDGWLKESIRSIILELDRFVGSMENTEKRRAAIQQISDILRWRKAIIPDALIGWVIDAEVSVIRKMQKTANTTILQGEDNGNG